MMPNAMPELQGSPHSNSIQTSGAFTKQQVDLAEVGVEKRVVHSICDGFIWFRCKLHICLLYSLCLCLLAETCLLSPPCLLSGSYLCKIFRVNHPSHSSAPSPCHGASFPSPTSTVSPPLAAAICKCAYQ